VTRFVLLAVCLLASGLALAAEPVRIAEIDAFSGPFADQGIGFQNHVRMAVEDVNARGGVLGGRKLELVTLDGKANPQESLLALQQVIDQNIRILVQASGSAVAAASIDAIAKHNQRNPDRSILYLNMGALDPALTNDKCSFWHFRFIPHGDMLLELLTNAIAQRKDVKTVYLINQDYAWGQSVSRDARAMLGRKRPDIRIVGDDLHSMGKVKDFSPYVAKIKAAGADAIITGNWGSDLNLLVRATKETGLTADLYAPLSYMQGAPTAMGEAGADRVKMVSTWHANVESNVLERYAAEYRARFKADWFWLPIKYTIDMLATSIDKAKSTDPLAIARALEGLRYAGPIGEVWMRADDHQIIAPMYLATFTKAGRPPVRHDAEGTGYGWRTDLRMDGKDLASPTNCRMQRPG
jgi:branched-chain amino acid transport system substrate-binding protein